MLIFAYLFETWSKLSEIIKSRWCKVYLFLIKIIDGLSQQNWTAANQVAQYACK